MTRMKRFNAVFMRPEVKIDFDWLHVFYRKFDPPRYGGLDWVLSLGVVQIRHWREMTDEDYEKLGVHRVSDMMEEQ